MIKTHFTSVLSLLLILISTDLSSQINGPTQVCGNDIKTYTTTVNASQYFWTATGSVALIPNGNSVSIQWANAVNGAVYLKAIDANGNPVADDTLFVNVFPGPNAFIQSSFNAGCNKVIDASNNAQIPLNDTCLTACVAKVTDYFTASIPNGIYTWKIIGDGTIIGNSNTPTIGVKWNTIGNYYISLVVDNGTNCRDSILKCVEVISSPAAMIGSQPNAVNDTITTCIDTEILFSDNSSENESRLWTFGDGTISAAKNPKKSYSNAGTYQVVLEAKSDCNCTSNDTVIVVVESVQGPEIICPAVVCQGDTVEYQTLSNCNNYDWSVENGTIIGASNLSTVKVVWNKHVGYITLSGQACLGACAQPTVIEIPVLSDSIEIEGPQFPCFNSQVTYSIPPIPGSQYTWYVDPSLGTIVKQEANAITVNVSMAAGEIYVIFDNPLLGCADTASLIVEPKPAIQLTVPATVCFSDTTLLQLPQNANWLLFDSANTLVYQQNNVSNIVINWSNYGSGEYILKAGAQTYCEISNQFTIQVLQGPNPPDTILGEDTVCLGNAYTYMVNPKNGYVVEWNIQGGTPTKRTGNRITVNWNGSSPYNLKAAYRQVQSPNCYSISKTLDIHIRQTPDTIVMPDSTCAGDTVFVELNHPVDQVEWEIIPPSAGSIVTDRLKSRIGIVFSESSVPSISFKAEGYSCGAFFSIRQGGLKVASFPDPIINYTPTNPCPNEILDFTYTNGGDTNIWTFSENDVIGGWIINRSFDKAGTYPVSLKAIYTTNFGCSVEKTVTERINVQGGPTLKIDVIPDQFCYYTPLANSILLNAVLQDSTPSVSNYEWFYKGNSVGNSSQYYTPLTNMYGSYKLEVTNANGCISKDSIRIDSCYGGSDPCFKDVQADLTVSCNQIIFRSFSSTTANLFDAHWETGPNADGILPDTFSYNEAGHNGLIITGKATLNSNPSDTVCFDKIVSRKMDFVLNFRPKLLECYGDSSIYLLENTSTYLSLPPSYFWDFGNGVQIGGGFNPIVKLPAGQQNITLSAVDSNSDTCSKVKSILVSDTVIADFIVPSQTCQQEPIQLINASQGNIVSYLWKTSGKTSTHENPTFTIEDAQGNNGSSYSESITLTIKDKEGCIDSTTQIISVKGNDLDGNIDPLNLPSICEGDSIEIEHFQLDPYTNTPISYLWSTLENSASIQAKQSGDYSLTLTDAVGCRKSMKPVNLQVNIPPNPIISGKQQYCEGEKTFLSTYGGEGIAYEWWLNGNPTGIENEDLEMVLPIDTHEVTLNFLDSSSNCQSSSPIFQLIVNPKPATPTITASSPIPLCESNHLTLTASSANATHYRWSKGESGDSIQAREAALYKVYAINEFGCETMDSIEVHPKPDFSNFMKGCYCISDTQNTALPGVVGMQSYQWIRNGQAVPPPFGISQDLLPSQSGTFQLAATTHYGCTDTVGYMEVSTVNCLGTCNLNLSDLQISCGGNSPQGYLFHFELLSTLSATYSANYQLSIQAYLNGQAVPNANLWPSSIAIGSTTLFGNLGIQNPKAGDTLCLQIVSTIDGVICSETICGTLPEDNCEIFSAINYQFHEETCQLNLFSNSTTTACSIMNHDSTQWIITQGQQQYTVWGQNPKLNGLMSGTAEVCVRLNAYSYDSLLSCQKDSCFEVEVPDCPCDENCGELDVEEIEFDRFIFENDSCKLQFVFGINNPTQLAYQIHHLRTLNGRVLNVNSTFGMPPLEHYAVSFYPNQPWQGGEACFELVLELEDGFICCIPICLNLPSCECNLELDQLNIGCVGPDSIAGNFVFDFNSILNGSTGFNYNSSITILHNGNMASNINYGPSNLQAGNNPMFATATLKNMQAGDSICISLTTELGGLNCSDQICGVLPPASCDVNPKFSYKFDANCLLTLTNETEIDSCTVIRNSNYNWAVNASGVSYSISGKNPNVLSLPPGPASICLSTLAYTYDNSNDCHPDTCLDITVPNCPCPTCPEGISIRNQTILHAYTNPCSYELYFSIENPNGSSIYLGNISSYLGNTSGLTFQGYGWNNQSYSFNFQPHQANFSGGEVCFDIELLVDDEICCIKFCMEIPPCGEFEEEGTLERRKRSEKSEIIQEVLIFPNPNQGSFQLLFNRSLDSKQLLTIKSKNGQIVWQEELNEGKLKYEVHTSNLASGLYVLEIPLKHKILRKKIIIN